MEEREDTHRQAGVTRSVHWQWSMLHRGLLVRCWGQKNEVQNSTPAGVQNGYQSDLAQRREVDLCHGEVSEMIVKTWALPANFDCLYICYVYKQSFQTPEMSHELKNNVFQLVISSTKYMYKQNRMKSESCQFLTCHCLEASIPTTFSNNWSWSRAYWRPYITAFRKYQLSLRSLSQHSTCSINYNQSMGGGVVNGSGGWWQWCCAIKYHTIKSKATRNQTGRGKRVKKKKRKK